MTNYSASTIADMEETIFAVLTHHPDAHGKARQAVEGMKYDQRRALAEREAERAANERFHAAEAAAQRDLDETYADFEAGTGRI